MATVFLVDDDLDGSEVVAQFLEKAGHTVCQSPGGHQALASIPVILPDVIITDIRMPHMDGFTFLRQLREDRLTAAIPALILTGFSDPDVAWKAATLGVAKVFLKGDYNLLDLLSCIESLAAAEEAPPAPPQHLLYPEVHGAEPVA
jgi:CheY-like chemotaxis protein